MLKKLISILLCAVLVLSCFAMYSCGKDEGGDDSSSGGTGDESQSEGKTAKNPSCADIMTAVVAAYPDIPKQKTLYLAGATEDSEAFIDPEFACYLYTANYEEFPEFASFADYAIRLPDGKSAFEIHIVKAASAGDVETVKSVLNQRIDRLNEGDIKLYDAENFEKVIKNASVTSDGEYVFLLITTDNAPANTAIQGAMYE